MPPKLTNCSEAALLCDRIGEGPYPTQHGLMCANPPPLQDLALCGVVTCVVRCLCMTDGCVAPSGFGLLVFGSRKVRSMEPTVASPTWRSTMPLSKPKSTTWGHTHRHTHVHMIMHTVWTCWQSQLAVSASKLATIAVGQHPQTPNPTTGPPRTSTWRNSPD